MGHRRTNRLSVVLLKCCLHLLRGCLIRDRKNFGYYCTEEDMFAGGGSGGFTAPNATRVLRFHNDNFHLDSYQD
jgi:hypothetical protein